MGPLRKVTFLAICAMMALQPRSAAQFGTCTTGWRECANGTCDNFTRSNGSHSAPTCFSLCQAACCSGYSGVEPTVGCGNPGNECTGNLYNQLVVFKSCGCDGRCPESCDCQASSTCCETSCFGTWMGYGEGCNTGSPILIDLHDAGAVYNLTSAENGVWFDLKAKGSPQLTAWTTGGSQVGFLALDRNGNGIIDDGAELFGTFTRKRDGSLARHGFDALADLDAAGAADGRIDSSDPVYAQLRFWIDANHNGQSELNELSSLAAVGITAIRTAYVEKKYMDKHGNWYRYEGRALLVNRGGKEVERRTFDVFFRLQNSSSRAEP